MSTYTEEEAKTKWCVHARVRDVGVAGVTNINFANGTTIKCIGSRCMSWRWRGDFGETGSKGYCGLAGVP